MSGYDMKTMCEANGVDYNNPQETDWVKEVFGTSWATQHSVTFQDGNDKGHFFTSVNYLDNDGIVRGKRILIPVLPPNSTQTINFISGLKSAQTLLSKMGNPQHHSPKCLRFHACSNPLTRSSDPCILGQR